MASEAFGADRLGAELDPVLARLTRHPLTLDIVGSLDRCRCNTLCALPRARGQCLHTAVRALATYGLIDRDDHPGTWDEPIPTRVPISLTGPGRWLADQLEQFDITVAI